MVVKGPKKPKTQQKRSNNPMGLIAYWRTLSRQTRKTILYVFFAAIAIFIVWRIVKNNNLFGVKTANLPDNCDAMESDYSFADNLHAAYSSGDYGKVAQLYGVIAYADKCTITRYANAWNKRWKGKDGGFFGLSKPWGNLYESISQYGCDTGVLDFTGINDCNLMNDTLAKLEENNLTTL